jgi:hypothetical protein
MKTSNIKEHSTFSQVIVQIKLFANFNHIFRLMCSLIPWRYILIFWSSVCDSYLWSALFCTTNCEIQRRDLWFWETRTFYNRGRDKPSNLNTFLQPLLNEFDRLCPDPTNTPMSARYWSTVKSWLRRYLVPASYDFRHSNSGTLANFYEAGPSNGGWLNKGYVNDFFILPYHVIL